jgi:hypothetical protein
LFQVSEKHPVVHANRVYWHNIPLKMRSHASTLYPDLAHYRVSADQAEKVHSGEVPEMFTRTTSPFAEFLPAVVLPTVGWLEYKPRKEILECPE